MLCCDVLYCIVLCCIVLCSVVLCCIVLYCIVLYNIVLCCVVMYCITLYCVVLLCIVLYYIVSCCYVLCCTILCCVVVRCILSHALKNTANQRPGLPLHILRYVTGNMQRVVFHSTFPSLLARNSLLGPIWGVLKSQLRNSSTPANHYEHFQSRPEIFRRFLITSEDFRKFSEIFKKS